MKLVSLEKDSNIIIDRKLITFLNPDYVYLPIGNSKLLVNQNDLLSKNMPVSQNVLSTISGYALGLITKNVFSEPQKCLVVENDFKEKDNNLKTRRKDITIETILKSLENHDDYLYNIFKSLKNCDEIILNTINDEPYVINKIINFKENINDILEFLDKLSILYKSKNIRIIVKNIDSDIIDECLNVLGTYPNIGITLVNDEYLLGRKDILLERLRIDVNKTLYLDSNDLERLINLVKYNKVSTTKIITISGDALKKSIVLKVKKYTLLKEIINKYLKIITDDYTIVVNNLLCGLKSDENLIISEEVESIHFMKNKHEKTERCIKCGKCINVCPMGINVVKYLKKKVNDPRCIDCGLCSYVCPSFINLKEFVRGDKS